MRTRIGLFGTFITLMQGGGETYIMQLAAELARTGEDVTLVYGTSPGRRLLPFREEPGVRYIKRLYLFGFRELARMAPRPVARIAYGIARRFHRWMIRPILPQFDIVHVFTVESAEAANLYRRPGQKLMLTLFGLPEPVDRSLLHRMDVVVPTATTLAAFVKRNMDIRGEVIPSGIDLARFRRIDRAAARERLGWGSEQHILYVGRFIPIKNLPTFLDAFSLVVQKLPNVRLVLTGQGILEQQLRAQVSSLGLTYVVRFAGHVTPDELAVQYSAADVLVVPSSYDTFPHVVLEALACGCPVVVSTGSEEIPRHFPEVTVVPWESSEAMASGIVDVLRNGQPHIRRERLEEFSWPVIAARYRNLYQRLAEDRS